MEIRVFAVPPFMKNAYLVACEETREAVLIDPGDEVAEAVAAARGARLNVRHILLTHAHLDHVTGVRSAKEAFAAPVHLHRADLPLYNNVVRQGQMFGFAVEPQPPVDAFLQEGSGVAFGRCEVTVHETPGHSPGGVCLAMRRAGAPIRDLFVGDTLFAGSIGRTDLPGGDYATLIRSIKEVLFAFDDDAIVHPGHGPDTTIGREKTTNPFVGP